MNSANVTITDAILERFWSKVRKTDTCWLWEAGKCPAGYGRFKINGSMFGPHRISYFLQHGDIKEGLCVCHKCDNPSCINPSHLFVATQKENIRDCLKKKRTKKFTLSNASKYNGVSWDAERKKWRSGIYIAERFWVLGRHESEVEAARNYDRIAFMKYGLKEGLNFLHEYNLS